MWLRAICALITALCSACISAAAATVTIAVSDASGHAVANAVVSLSPDGSGQTISHLPDKAIIDQRQETFIPLVVVVRRGGSVVFTNHDTTMHQVYSFAPIKQFQFVIKEGDVSDPVVFDTPGVAAIGCNIHDQMIAYVYVADAPFAAITDEGGHAVIPDVPDGSYRVATWHPQLPIGQAEPVTALKAAGDSTLPITLPFDVMPMRSMKHMHMDY